ncbi:MAG: lipid-A-disaccharide synthase N-terminal domain-containing protein [Candidatus Omnitrophota bacterium]|nr:lipid-A-disaccharide synthase N-terminal domain-containing protein [Candidatus Omnitrophota bacterium]
MLLFERFNENIWLVIGFLGQSCFFLRFLIQWIVSERRKKSTIPLVFWYLSFVGAFSVLIYAMFRKDPVFIIGQSMGLMVYSRNLWLIYSRRRAMQG